LNESEPLKRCREVAYNQSKATKYETGRKVMLAIALITEITYLFSVRLASFRWQELYSGLFTELGKLHANAKGNAQ
jgi:hypothetical protein